MGHQDATVETRPVVKRTARAILLDGGSNLRMVLIKRTKPGLEPYWITPGGGVEPGDTSVVAALHRELDEELGAKITQAVPAFVDTVVHDPDSDDPGFENTDPDGSDGSGPRDLGPAGAGEPDAAGHHPDAVKVQHFFVCRLASMDPAQRHGPEVERPRGEYEIVTVPFTSAGIDSVELVPPSLRAYLRANIEGVPALLAPDLI